MGEQTILCGVLQTGSILMFNKMVEKGIDPWNMLLNLSNYGWEVTTEALKLGGNHQYDGIVCRILPKSKLSNWLAN